MLMSLRNRPLQLQLLVVVVVVARSDAMVGFSRPVEIKRSVVEIKYEVGVTAPGFIAGSWLLQVPVVSVVYAVCWNKDGLLRILVLSYEMSRDYRPHYEFLCGMDFRIPLAIVEFTTK
ncbi:hypothetical protein BDD12DRAFT_809813 [Trichophaea hybrida]|nr:hypothetical protein BDD12DRAFT_809813 [Trichophaea hybrida]